MTTQTDWYDARKIDLAYRDFMDALQHHCHETQRHFDKPTSDFHPQLFLRAPLKDQKQLEISPELINDSSYREWLFTREVPSQARRHEATLAGIIMSSWLTHHDPADPKAAARMAAESEFGTKINPSRIEAVLCYVVAPDIVLATYARIGRMRFQPPHVGPFRLFPGSDIAFAGRLVQPLQAVLQHNKEPK